MEDTLQNNGTQPTNQQASESVADLGGTDRTREQFEKLTNSNQALNQEKQRLQAELEALRAKQAPAPVQPTVRENIQQAQASGIDPASYVEVDPSTGERFVNEGKLNNVIAELQSKTVQAEQTINNYIKTNEERRIQQQKEEAFKAHPELELGSDKFDQRFYQKVRATLRDSMFNAGEYGKVFTLKEAADFVKAESAGTQDSGKSQDKQEQVNLKAEAAANAPSLPQNAPRPTNSDELKALRLATRKGDVNALAHRLLATDHVLKN